jgi:hypothetical protein
VRRAGGAAPNSLAAVRIHLDLVASPSVIASEAKQSRRRLRRIASSPHVIAAPACPGVVRRAKPGTGRSRLGRHCA